jgi:hypothetical protein
MLIRGLGIVQRGMAICDEICRASYWVAIFSTGRPEGRKANQKRLEKQEL